MNKNVIINYDKVLIKAIVLVGNNRDVCKRENVYMHVLMNIVNVVGIIVLFGEILFVLHQKKSHMQNLLLIMLVALQVNFAGYLFELNSDNLEEALQGVKFAYLGKPFIILSMFLFVVDFCKVKLGKVFRDCLVLAHVAITLLVFTCEYNSLFYSSIDYTYEGLFPHLVLGHGTVYYVYTLLVFAYFVSIVVISIRRFISTRDDLVKHQIILIMSTVVVCIGGLALFLSGATFGYDATLPAYFISETILLLVMTRYQLFNTLSYAREDATEHLAEAIIVYDNDEEIVYLNHNARLLKEYVEENYNDSLFSVLSSYEAKKKHLIVENGSIFKGDRSDYKGNNISDNSAYHIISREIARKNMKYGRTFVVADETDSYYYTKRLKADVKNKTREIVKMQRSIIASFASMIEARDGITGLHIKNTSSFVSVLCRALLAEGKFSDELTEENVQMIIEAASLHDIGKISIPDYVLQKPGKLTDEEFEIMKTHPGEGARIIKETLVKLENDKYVSIAYDMAYYHHEKFGGGGYPCNLKGNEIPVSARIMAICDVYDALRSKRHYKEDFSVEKAVSIIRESRGTHFDPEITDVFLEHIDEMEAVLEAGA